MLRFASGIGLCVALFVVVSEVTESFVVGGGLVASVLLVWLSVEWVRVPPDRERWARAGVYLVRALLVSTVAISLLATVGLSSVRFASGPVEEDGNGISVEVEAVNTWDLTLCPSKMVAVKGSLGAFRERPDRSCKQARFLRAYIGPNAYVVEPIPLRVAIKNPTAGDKLRLGALKALGWLALLAGGVGLERMLTAASRRQPFAARNVVWMRVVALSVAVYWIVLPLLTRPVASLLADHSGSDRGTSHWRGYSVEIQPVWPDNLLWWVGPLAVVMALLALAEVWRSGVALRDDVEATV